MEEQSNPFESPLVRSLIGLSGGIAIAVAAVLFFEGMTRWLLIGLAVFDALVTPYILKLAVAQQQEGTDASVP